MVVQKGFMHVVSDWGELKFPKLPQDVDFTVLSAQVLPPTAAKQLNKRSDGVAWSGGGFKDVTIPFTLEGRDGTEFRFQSLHGTDGIGEADGDGLVEITFGSKTFKNRSVTDNKNPDMMKEWTWNIGKDS